MFAFTFPWNGSFKMVSFARWSLLNPHLSIYPSWLVIILTSLATQSLFSGLEGLPLAHLLSDMSPPVFHLGFSESTHIEGQSWHLPFPWPLFSGLTLFPASTAISRVCLPHTCALTGSFIWMSDWKQNYRKLTTKLSFHTNQHFLPVSSLLSKACCPPFSICHF